MDIFLEKNIAKQANQKRYELEDANRSVVNIIDKISHWRDHDPLHSIETLPRYMLDKNWNNLTPTLHTTISALIDCMRAVRLFIQNISRSVIGLAEATEKKMNIHYKHLIDVKAELE